MVWLLIICGLVFLYVVVINGGAHIGSIILPYVITAGRILLTFNIVVSLPLLLFKKTRGAGGLILYISSYLFGLEVWLYSFLVTYAIWGGGAVLIGLLLGGVGVYPIALLASLFHGEWSLISNLIFGFVLAIGSRWVGYYFVFKVQEEKIIRGHGFAKDALEKSVEKGMSQVKETHHWPPPSPEFKRDLYLHKVMLGEIEDEKIMTREEANEYFGAKDE